MPDQHATAAVSTRNPPPCNLGEVVLKIDQHGQVRMRTDDEATEAGQGLETPSFFILCPGHTKKRCWHCPFVMRSVEDHIGACDRALVGRQGQHRLCDL